MAFAARAADACVPNGIGLSREGFVLLNLADDIILRLLTFARDERDVLAAACCSTALAVICRTEALWQVLCIRRWPKLRNPSIAAPLFVQSASWRALHQQRARCKYWRELCVLLDESIDMVSASAARATSAPVETAAEVHTEAEAPCAFASSVVVSVSQWAVGLAKLVIAIHSARNKGNRRLADTADEPEMHRFRKVFRHALLDACRLGALRSWAAASARSLDAWYDYAMLSTSLDADSAAGVRELRARLRTAQEARSALELLYTELKTGSEEGDDLDCGCRIQPPAHEEHASFLELWEHAELPIAIHDIETSILSLEMEGFNVAVPPGARPEGIPQSHWWWWCKPPMGYNVC
uniref:F-box domain-containing protein n=1 Tax=Calcidiscus leptoporus TaxID=127549 RepID=A0A7S0J8S5_9EUKA|mmetsp:Transcript_45294/g.105777  ORF Transcript_45294/g.105777 Transcript_45294/m.105777 type:complete len:353 (+) Transcript_45294:81-1139(+)